MYDEVAIVKFMISQGKCWQQIGRGYDTIPWKAKSEDPYILHYFNTPKPWQTKKGKWPDLKLWYDTWDELVLKYDIKL